MHISNAISSSTNVKNGAAKWCWFKVFCTQFGAFKFAFDNSFLRISNFVLHLSLHLYIGNINGILYISNTLLHSSHCILRFCKGHTCPSKLDESKIYKTELEKAILKFVVVVLQNLVVMNLF